MLIVGMLYCRRAMYGMSNIVAGVSNTMYGVSNSCLGVASGVGMLTVRMLSFYARNYPDDFQRCHTLNPQHSTLDFIIVMIRWTGLAPWEFEFPFPGSLTSTFLRRGGDADRADAVLLCAKLPR